MVCTQSICNSLGPFVHGYGSKLNHQGTAGSSHFHLPGCNFGVVLFLTTTQLGHTGPIKVTCLKKPAPALSAVQPHPKKHNISKLVEMQPLFGVNWFGLRLKAFCLGTARGDDTGNVRELIAVAKEGPGRKRSAGDVGRLFVLRCPSFRWLQRETKENTTVWGRAAIFPDTHGGMRQRVVGRIWYTVIGGLDFDSSRERFCLP